MWIKFTVAGVIAMAFVLAQNAGVRLAIDAENSSPALRIHLPGQSNSDPGIFVLFPEHVTAREKGKTNAHQMYLFRPGQVSTRPNWRQTNRSVSYEMEFQPGVRMIAIATSEEDGVRYRYEFTNRSTVHYDLIQAVTDSRMVTPYFRDVRLQRTFVHHANGFELLAAETPNRVNLPLDRWLPNRHRVSYTWPIEPERVVKQADGITWYNKSRAVDEPFIATESTDGRWIVATFSYDPGNVWVNPDLTCQHADPQITLPPGETRSYELKTLIVQASLDTVLAKVKLQRLQLQH